MFWFGEKVYLADHVLHLSVSPALLSKILGSENVYCETVWLADIGLAKTFFLSIIPRLGQSNDGIFFSHSSQHTILVLDWYMLVHTTQ